MGPKPKEESVEQIPEIVNEIEEINLDEPPQNLEEGQEEVPF